MTFLQKIAPYKISRYFKVSFFLCDIIILNAVNALSMFLRFNDLNRLQMTEVQTISLLSNLIWVLLLFYKKQYLTIRNERVDNIVERTIEMVFIHFAIISIFITLLKYEDVSRVRILYFYGLFFVFLILSRILLIQFLKYVRSKGYNYKNIVIVGVNDSGMEIYKNLSRDLTNGYRIKGYFDDFANSSSHPSLKILGKLDAIGDYLTIQKIDEIYVAVSTENITILNDLIELCERYMVRLKLIPIFFQYTKTSRLGIEYCHNMPVVMLRKEPLESTLNRIIKKIFDLCFSLFVIVLIFPWLFPVLMILIKMESPGPVFFRQKRSGRDNKDFTCLKFRTMKVNAQSNSAQATKGDARVTKLGAFMRKTNLDELPQFFNVLWGTMSVVGPRPHMLLHTEQYTELINHYLVRHYAKPGITGWAQISGYRGETKEVSDMENRVDYDIWYIENWSFLLDLKIIFLTVYNVFRGEKNAY